MSAGNSFITTPASVEMKLRDKDKFTIYMIPLILLSMLIFAYIITQFPTSFDYPIIKSINALAGHHRIVDFVAYTLDHDYMFSGVTLIAIIWGLWFRFESDQDRATLALGVFSAFFAGVVSRLCQYSLPTHPRPIYDSALGFHKPLYVFDIPFNTWNSFPSDHVTVFVGYATVILVSAWQWRGRWVVLAWICFVEMSRMFMGGHYPADVLGGASLGSATVLIAVNSRLHPLTTQIIKYGTLHKQLFYTIAFVVSYELANLFTNVRSIFGGILGLRHVL